MHLATKIDEEPCSDSASSERLVVQLQNPSAYPHSVEGRIELHETHISWVLLAGHFAYKIKKPIKTDFLDFSILEKRHHACCEELRLDSRYAEGLYLDVVPITIEDGMVKMDGDAQPIEFAVRMRRFPPQSLLSDRLQAGQVTSEEMIQFATTLANFHRRAESLRESSDRILSETHELAKANFETLDGEETCELKNRLDKIRVWSEQSFVEHQGLFHRRVREGFIRECHGDLHSDNIVFWHDHWVPFDGIEFNPKLSWIDVLNDVGFLVMDLRARDRLDLAAVFLNAYLEQTGDYEALPLLRWYMVYRAMVRAKVALIRYRQMTPGDADRQDQFAKLTGMIRLANELAEPADRQLWITHGVSGSGKTTGSQRLVSESGLIRVRSDVERKRLFGTRQNAPSAVGIGQGLYSATATEATYQVLLLWASKILQAGFSAIVDATFLRRADRKRFHALAVAEGVPYRILDFQVDEATLRQRVLERSRARTDASDADIQVLGRQLADQEPLTDEERTWVVNMTENVAAKL